MEEYTKQRAIPDLNTIMEKINSLVKKQGYVYSLLLIIIHDLFLSIGESLDIDWRERLSYQEVSFLFGIMIHEPINLDIIPNETTSKLQIEETYRLLREIHDYYNSKVAETLFKDIHEKQKHDEKLPQRTNIFTSPESIIEAVFYDDSGAYDFQYWESAPKRYAEDRDWIIQNLGFTIEDAVEISKFIKKSSEEKRLQLPPKGDFTALCKWALHVFTIKKEELPKDSKTINNFFSHFAVIPGNDNKKYQLPSDQNELNVKPFINISPNLFLFPVSFDLSRAIDESPFYFIKELDEKYFQKALQHRGNYTEYAVYQKLVKVFGTNKVYRGAKIRRPKGEGIKKKGYEYTDIDVLVLYGNKAIVVQAKSKKMTLLSRTGNLHKFGEDFQMAVQEAYSQGLKSREHILAHDASFIDEEGNGIKLNESINEVYILTVTTDNYPALFMQVYSLLQKDEKDPWPLSISLFDLDLLVKYLPDPYDFLYYVNQRICFSDKIISGSEIACLGFHLDQKLYIDPSKADRMMIDESFGQMIDDDIIRQAYGDEEEKKKGRIRQKWNNENFTKLVSQIKSSNEPGLTDALFLLYSLSSKTADKLVEVMERQKMASQVDHGHHTMAMPLSGTSGGITFFVLYDREQDLHKNLLAYSMARKYKTKVNEWLGLGSYATSENIVDSVVYVKKPWEYDPELERLESIMIHPVRPKSIGRNDPCYCGSGIKYKKCHYLKGEDVG